MLPVTELPVVSSRRFALTTWLGEVLVTDVKGLCWPLARVVILKLMQEHDSGVASEPYYSYSAAATKPLCILRAWSVDPEGVKCNGGACLLECRICCI